MKNLLNCHSIGLHSFLIYSENGLCKRIFYADKGHNMWKESEIAIHPHHTDVKITVLEGEIYNLLYEVNDNGEEFNEYKWGNNSFEYLGKEKLKLISNNLYKAYDVIFMRSYELHTMKINRRKSCVWMFEEFPASCKYIPINYSKLNLLNWSPDGLYIEVGDDIRDKYIGRFL